MSGSDNIAADLDAGTLLVVVDHGPSIYGLFQIPLVKVLSSL